MSNDAIDYINRDIVNVKEELRTISKIVRDGNGQPSLIQQVTVLQSEINRMESELKEQISNIQEGVDSIRQKEKEKSSSSWQFKTAVLVALISSITSVYMHYMDKGIENTEQKLIQALEKLDRLDKMTPAGRK